MQRHDIPLSARQIALLALIMIAPAVFAFGFIYLASSKPGEAAAAAPILGASMLLIGGIFVTVVVRHRVELQPGSLTVRHSMYTLNVERSEVLGVRPLSSMTELALSVRTNGIAAFGYRSGWFRRGRGERTFCAISEQPIYLMTFKEGAKSRYLALSAGPELARSLEAWASKR